MNLYENTSLLQEVIEIANSLPEGGEISLAYKGGQDWPDDRTYTYTLSKISSSNKYLLVFGHWQVDSTYVSMYSALYDNGTITSLVSGGFSSLSISGTTLAIKWSAGSYDYIGLMVFAL